MNSQTLSPPYSIGVLMLDGFNAMAMNTFIDPFRTANYISGKGLYKWVYLGLDNIAVNSSNGQRILPDATLDKHHKLDCLLVNASWEPERFIDKHFFSLLREYSNNKTLLCGLDTGAFLFAHAGLLKSKKAAVHYDHIASFREIFPDITMDEAIFVQDQNILTCSGGMAATDAALHIIMQHHGFEMANAAGRYIFHERMREGNENQLPSTQEPIGLSVPIKLKEAISVMESNLENTLPITQIAQTVGLSQRQLSRLFSTYTGQSPVKYYLDVRLDRARSLVTGTELNLLSIAIASGFGGASQFSRSYQNRFGISPSKDRIEGRVPFQFRSFPSHAGLK